MSEWKRLTLCGHKIPAGRQKTILVDIARLHTRTAFDLPVIIHKAKEPGPVVLLTAGIHGDEINGVEVLRRMIRHKKLIPEKGMVICIPVVNIFGFLNHQRYFPDGRDLNRCFPGSKNGSLASRFARFIMTEICPSVDCIIDLHTGGASRNNSPQIRYNPEDPMATELAKAFGCRFLIPSKIRDKSFRQAATQIGKSVIMFEGGRSMDISADVCEKAEDGISRVLHFLSIQSAGQLEERQQLIVDKSTWVRSNYSGMFTPRVTNGAPVSKGEVLGLVSDPFGQFEHKIKAPAAGLVFCINEYPIVNQGDAILNLATRFSST